MHIRTLLIGLLALVFGGSAAMGVYILFSQTGERAESAKTSIVFATVDLSRGSGITEESVELRAWPKDLVPEGAITSLEDVLDRSVSIPFVKGEPVLESKLAAPGAGRGMAALIPSGMRAVTIQTPNVATGMAGFILPGDRVDVLVTLSSAGFDDSSGGAGTTTLLQNVEILAVDQRIQAPSENLVDPRELRSVTLLVTPAEAARLDLGQNKGTLSLTLRNPADTELGDMESATLAGLRSPRKAGEDTFLDLLDDDNLAGGKSRETNSQILEPVSALKPNTPYVIPPIRTLRGSMSGAVQLQPIPIYY
jgi:pilus assembly protein CpaB